MGETKRFYWLKLKEDFFRQKEIKKLRKLAGGDTFTIIYLKMLLRSLKDGGRLYYEGVEDNFASELALDIDEDEENVKIVVAFLMANNILTQNEPDEYELMTAHEMTDSECDSAARVRRLRERKALEAGGKALLCNGDVTNSNGSVTARNIEIDIELEKKERVRENTRKRFTPPTIDELKAYAKEKGYTRFNAESFEAYYASKGWTVGKSPMKDWKAAVRGWVARDRQDEPEPQTYVPAYKDLPREEQERRQRAFEDEYWAKKKAGMI